MTTSIDSFLRFLSASPSAFHAANQVRSLLVGKGFLDDASSTASPTTPGGHVAVEGGAVVAWWIPEEFDSETSRFRIVGSHTDSPGLMVKPRPDVEGEGIHQVAVEVYGGPILQSWFDRDLAFAGRVVDASGKTHLVNTGPIARVPNLAIHLYRADTPPVERQQHTQPVLGVDRPLLDIIAEQIGLDGEQVVAHELISVDTQEGAVIGDMLMAGRLDNLSSVWASLEALIEAQREATHSDVLVLVAFNHEEVGSNSPTGAAGPLLERFLRRIASGLGVNDFLSLCARSSMISADAAHAVHPNYATKHDPSHRPLLNAGPVLKVNANQRYASDAETEATWLRACEAACVPNQVFVGNNDVPCGSTIGPIAATRLGIPTVDVGVPLLSMHSAREMCGVEDMKWFVQAIHAFYTDARV